MDIRTLLGLVQQDAIHNGSDVNLTLDMNLVLEGSIEMDDFATDYFVPDVNKLIDEIKDELDEPEKASANEWVDNFWCVMNEKYQKD